MVLAPEPPQIAETTSYQLTDCTNVADAGTGAGAFFAPSGAVLVATLLVHIADGTPLAAPFGDKAEVTNHECQRWWHELGSVVQRETVRTRRESTRPVRGGRRS